MLHPVPAIDNFLEVNLEALLSLCARVFVRRCVHSCGSPSSQIVCVPHDWRVTLVIIIVANAAVSFLLEV